MNLFYDKAAHKDWSGGEESAGCYLFMSALVQYAKDNNKEFDQTPLEVYPDGKEEDMLRKETRNFAGRPACYHSLRVSHLMYTSGPPCF